MPSSSSSAIFSTNRIESVWGYLNPIRIALDLFRRRQLIWQFTLREVQGRYRGSYLGMVWALITPLLMLIVYTAIFHGVFHARWNENDPHEHFMIYAMYMFSGIIVFNIFGESISRAPLLIVQNPNYVKKVVFPLEVLPLSLIGSALIHSTLSLVILLVGAFTGAGGLHWTLVFLPVVLLPITIFTMGICWFLCSLGVFLRDIGNIISVAVTLLFFLTPITYPLEQLRVGRSAMKFNVLWPMIYNFRRVVNVGVAPDWASFSISLLISIVVAMFGYAWFMKIKRAFADVL